MATSNDQLANGFLQSILDESDSSGEGFDVESISADRKTSYSAPVGLGETFGAGVTSGAEGMVGDLEYLKALGNSLIGDEEASAANVKAARIKGEIASNATYGMETFDQFVKNPTFNGFFDQVVLGVGQITPSVVTSMATGFTGVLAGAAGKAAMGVTAKAAAKKLTEQALAKKAAGEVLDKAEQEYLDATYALYSKEALKYGGIAGMVAGEYPFMAGGSFGEYDEAGVDLSADRALQSLLIGGAQTAVSVGGEVFVLGKLAALAKSKPGTNPKLLQALAGSGLKGLGTSGATESATEVIQESMGIAQRMSVDDSYTWEQAQLRLGQAAFIGFFGGGVPGAIGGTAAGGYNFATQGGADAIFKKAQGMLDDRADASARTELDREELGIPDDGIDPAAESNEDIAAQVAATVDPEYGKQATWVPISQGLSSNGAPNEVTEQTIEGTKVYAAFIPNRGTILSGDRALVEEVVKSGADDASLSIALDYSDTRKGNLVVRVKNNSGEVIHEQQVDEAGQDAALVKAQKVAGTKGVVDVVSGQQALADRKARRDDSISTRNMLNNQDIDEVDLNEQEGSFTTEAEERELAEGFNEVDEFASEEVADFAISDQASQSEPGVFENNWAEILSLVPPQERKKIAGLQSKASESFARSFLSYLKNDPGYYSVEERGGRLFITRAPDSADSFLSGASKEGAAEQRATTVVQKLISGIGKITALTSNRNYFIRGEQRLRRNPTKADPKKEGEQFKTKLDIETFTVEGPDGQVSPIRINDIVVAGRKLNVGTQDALVGENLSPEQSTKAALLRGLAVLLEQGYKVSFMGKPLNFAQAGIVSNTYAGQLDLLNTNEELVALERQQMAALTDPNWARDLNPNGQRFFNDLIIFQSGGKQFSLGDLLQTADPTPQESIQSAERGEQQPRIALERAERRIEQQIRDYINSRRQPIIRMNRIVEKIRSGQPLTDSETQFLETSGLPQRFLKVPDYAELEKEAREIANDPEADRLSVYTQQELEKLQEAEKGFSPSDITSQAQTEPVVGSQGQTQSLTPEADALKQVSQWQQDELQRQREAMNAGTRPVVTPAQLEAEVAAQLPAKREEFLAAAEANSLQTPEGLNTETNNPFTGSGTTTGGSVELVDQIEQQQIQAAREAGVFLEDQTQDPDPQLAKQARDRSAALDTIRSEREINLLQAGGRIEQDNEASIREQIENGEISQEEGQSRLNRNVEAETGNIPFEGISDFEADKRRRQQRNQVQRAIEPATHPSRLVIEEAPASGGRTETQVNASGDVRNRVSNPKDVAFRTEVVKFLSNNNVSPANVERYTKIVGDFGPSARRVLEKALKIFRQQIKKPISVYTQSAYLEENQRVIKAQFDRGDIDLSTMYEELGRIAEQMPAGRGSLITFQDRYVVIINDTFSDGDPDGLNDMQMAAVLGHELGHIVFDQEIRRLVDAGGPQLDMLKKAFEETLKNSDVLQYEGKHGFEEWYADQVASFLYDEAKKATDGPTAYFKKIATLMRKFFDEVNKLLDGRLTKNDDFRKYVRDFLKASKDNNDLYGNLTGDSHLDAIDKMAIRNWNGALSDHVPPKVTQAVARMTKRMLSSGAYGFLKKYTTASDNWLRGLGPAGVELARFFQAKSQSTEKSGFHHDKQRVENTYMQKLATALGVNPNNSSQWDTPELNDILLEAEDETIDTADLKDPRSKAVRAVFEEFHEQYLSAKGKSGKPFFEVRRRKNYAPRLMDFSVLTDDSEAGALARENLAQLILQYAPEMVATHRTKRKQTYQPDDMDVARDIVKEIIADPAESSEVMREQRAQRKQSYLDEAKTDEERTIIELMLPDDDQETDGGAISPGMKNSLARTLNMIPTKELRKINVIAPPVVAFTQYFHHATRRVEFEKRGGEQRIYQLIAALPEEHRAYALQAVRGQLGRVGIGMKGWVRNVNSFDAVMTSTTTLLFTAMVSFTDTAGPIIRSKDFAGMGRAFREIGKTLSSDENQKLSRAVGVASAEAAANIFMAAGELDYANSTSRKILDKFFRYTGLQLYTRFSREFAAGMGREFLIDIADRDKSETTDRWLAELDITRDQIKTWNSGNGDFTSPEGKAVARAIAKFVDESIVRPNAAERPVWASHPMAMIAWRLKSYFYSFGKVIVGGMAREMKNRYREDGDFRGGGMLLALAMGTLLPLAALGMELKELTRYMLQALFPGIEATGRVFRSDHMAAPEYLATIFEKTGALGPWAIPVSIISSAQWGDNPIVSQVPLIDMFDATLLEGNWTRPIPILNNVD